MAERLNKRHTDLVLKRIRTSQLVQRLQNHALGLLKSPKDAEKPILMTDGQVRAACFLIERTLAKAEAPKDLNLTGSVTLQVVTGVPSGDG